MDVDWWYNRMQSLTPEEKAGVMMAGPFTWSRDERTIPVCVNDGPAIPPPTEPLMERYARVMDNLVTYVRSIDYNEIPGNDVAAMDIPAAWQVFPMERFTVRPWRYYTCKRTGRRNRHK